MGLFKKKEKEPYRPTGRFAIGQVSGTGEGWLNRGQEFTWHEPSKWKDEYLG